MKTNNYILMTVLILSSMAIATPTIGSEMAGEEPAFSLPKSAPLIAKSLTGDEYAINTLTKGATVKDIKAKVAELWNQKHHTNVTADKVALAGPGAFVSKGDESIVYNDNDVISRDALLNAKQRVVWLAIKE